VKRPPWNAGLELEWHRSGARRGESVYAYATVIEMYAVYSLRVKKRRWVVKRTTRPMFSTKSKPTFFEPEIIAQGTYDGPLRVGAKQAEVAMRETKERGACPRNDRRDS